LLYNASLNKKSLLSLLWATVVGLTASDIYLVSLPEINKHFPRSCLSSQIVFLSGAAMTALTPLWLGPLSDLIGRKKIMSFGAIFLLVGNFICSLNVNIINLLIGQIGVGVGAGALLCMPRAILSDLYNGKVLAQALSYLSMATTIPIMIAPILGGIIQEAWHWRGNFILVTILSISLLPVLKNVPESLREKSKNSYSLYYIFYSYKNLIQNEIFIKNSILAGGSFAIIFLYHLAIPFIFQNKFGFLPSTTGLIYLFSALSYLCGNFIFSKYSHQLAARKEMILVICLGIISNALILFLGTKFLDSIILMSIIFINTGISGILTPFSFKNILQVSTIAKGTASALINFLRMLAGLLISLLYLGASPYQDACFSIILITLSGLLLAIWCVLVYSNKGETKHESFGYFKQDS
jgi:MFS family permease